MSVGNERNSSARRCPLRVADRVPTVGRLADDPLQHGHTEAALVPRIGVGQHGGDVHNLFQGQRRRGCGRRHRRRCLWCGLRCGLRCRLHRRRSEELWEHRCRGRAFGAGQFADRRRRCARDRSAAARSAGSGSRPSATNGVVPTKTPAATSSAVRHHGDERGAERMGRWSGEEWGVIARLPAAVGCLVERDAARCRASKSSAGPFVDTPRVTEWMTKPTCDIGHVTESERRDHAAEQRLRRPVHASS